MVSGYYIVMRSSVFSFALGVLCLQLQPAWHAWMPFLLGGVLLLPMVWRRRGWLARSMTIGLCFAIGFGWASWQAGLRLQDELPSEQEGRDLEIVGVVAELPQAFSRGERFEFVVEKTLTASAHVPSRIMLSWFHAGADDGSAELRAVRPGERWQLTVRLRKPHGNSNPGGFEYEAWLLERNIRATGYVRSVPVARRIDTMVWQPTYLIERLRYKVRAGFAERLPAAQYPWAGILVALTIGDQRAINGDLWTVFNRTGTTHLMSISGLHVTMVAALFGWLVSSIWRRTPWLALRLPAQKAGLLGACLAALVYTLLAGFAVPAQRTLYMLLVAGLAMFSGRIIAPSRTLSLALLLVLLIDPWAILAAGFWLSFGAVGALLYIGSAGVGRATGWRQHLAAWGLVQWAATLASLPVLLLVFQQFSLISPVANALAIPVVSFVITPLALLGVVLPWWPILLTAHVVLDALMVFITWCAIWPIWQAPAPPLWAALLAGLGVFIVLLPRGVPGRLIGLSLMIPAVFWPLDKPPAGEAWVTVLDVGQGLASVIRTREHTLIYDPGPLYSAESDAGQRVVLPYLRWLGINRVDKLIVTHRDSDHSGGAASVQAGLAVGQVLSSVAGLGGEFCVDGQSWTWDGVLFEVLHPTGKDYAVNAKANHISCVLRVSTGQRRLLLTSDIEAPDEAALLARYPGDLSADVMLVPHHGSRTSSTADFISAVGARHAIIPVGYRNRFGHPRPDVTGRYEAAGAELWRTDRDGAVQVVLNQEGAAISAWRPTHRRYWHGR